MDAADTLKVKKVRFFVEPKMALLVPIPSYKPYNYYLETIDGYGKGNDNVHNITTVNFGICAGLSVKLTKHLSYEGTLSYFHFKEYTKVTGTSESYSVFVGKVYNFEGFDKYRYWYDFFGIGNGISFSYKKFIFTNTIMTYLFIAERYQKEGHNNVDNSSSLQTISANTANSSSSINNSSNPLYSLMTEHKIGYSCFKKRIEPNIGIIFSEGGPFGNTFAHPASSQPPPGTIGQPLMPFCKYTLMPFASVKINF